MHILRVSLRTRAFDTCSVYISAIIYHSDVKSKSINIMRDRSFVIEVVPNSYPSSSESTMSVCEEKCLLIGTDIHFFESQVLNNFSSIS